MPTYEYECEACGHAFDLFQQMSDAVKRKCPKCHKRSLQRRVGIGAGVLFKGSGFYETDYRSDSYRKAAEAEKKSTAVASADGKVEASKSEAPKAEAKPVADAKNDSAPAKKSRATSSRTSRKKSSRKS